MSLKDEFLATYPDFPWLSPGNVPQLQGFLEARGWLDSGETVSSCNKAGEGNMNLTLRIETDRRSMILKQARPWVEKYDFIPAPWDRMLYEQRFYERAGKIPETAARMPKLLHSDAEARVVILEDLRNARDFTDMYTGRELEQIDLTELSAYLAALHTATRGAPDSNFANREMRVLNHQHIFVVPLLEDNGIDLESYEPGLTDAANQLRRDSTYTAAVSELGQRYLDDGPVLVHGDYFPGSWLKEDLGIRVIDGEFCYFGDAEFDLGVAIAHFRMANRDLKETEFLLGEYDRNCDVHADQTLAARFAAVEIMRRLIGVAQLPIPNTTGFRADLLARSRKAMLNQSIGDLWS